VIYYNPVTFKNPVDYEDLTSAPQRYLKMKKGLRYLKDSLSPAFFHQVANFWQNKFVLLLSWAYQGIGSEMIDWFSQKKEKDPVPVTFDLKHTDKSFITGTV
jgi:hypothetical protein